MAAFGLFHIETIAGAGAAVRSLTPSLPTTSAAESENKHDMPPATETLNVLRAYRLGPEL